LFIGFESLNEMSLSGANKGFVKINNYRECLKKLHDNGIHVLASFVFGFDQDDTSVFERTADFLVKSKVVAASLSVLVPYPGTKVYQQMEAEGRILTKDWSRYDYDKAVFRPKLMEPEILEDGVRWTVSEFYSRSSIISRLAHNWRHPLIFAMMNANYRAKNREILGMERPF